MTRPLLLGVAAMAVIVVASNILVQFLVGDWLTWGAFTYPFAFLVTDLMNRFYGPARGAEGGAGGLRRRARLQLRRQRRSRGRSGRWSACAWRSARPRAFLVGQLLDVAVFNRLRAGSWWRAPFVSSISGSVVDTVIFFSLAFSAGFAFIAPQVDVAWANEAVPLLGRGPVAPLWMSPRGCRFLGQAGDRGVRAGAVPRRARAGTGSRRAEIWACLFAADATIRATETSERR